MFKNTPPPRRFCNKNGFSLVELIVVILIIAILAVAVFAGGSAAIKKAHIAKATSDLHNFQIAVEMTLNETPLVANIATETKKAQLESIMDALNDNLAADYKLTAVDGTLTGNITKTAATTDDASFIICRSDKTDSWGNPYFVIIDRAERGGSAASEFYMTTVTAGPNAILHLDGAIDGDDVFSLTSYADGDVISATYNMAEAAPTIVGGAEAATSYTAVMTAPVNNGVTVGGYVAPETPAQDPQQGGGDEPAAKQTPTAPTLSATNGSVTEGNTTSFTVSRQGTGAVSAVSANSSVATASVSGTTVTVTGVSAGSTTINVSVEADSTYTASSVATYTVFVGIQAEVTNLVGTTWLLNEQITDLVPGDSDYYMAKLAMWCGNYIPVSELPGNSRFWDAQLMTWQDFVDLLPSRLASWGYTDIQSTIVITNDNGNKIRMGNAGCTDFCSSEEDGYWFGINTPDGDNLPESTGKISFNEDGCDRELTLSEAIWEYLEQDAFQTFGSYSYDPGTGIGSYGNINYRYWEIVGYGFNGPDYSSATDPVLINWLQENAILLSVNS